MNRETWLNELATKMAPRFEELGFPLPKFRVAVGWTSAGKTTKMAGECWHSSNSADRAFEILVAPTNDNSLKIAFILAHELTHAAVGFKCGHKGDFAKVMKALGAMSPMTTPNWGDDFNDWVNPFLSELGPIPHARIMLQPDRQPREGGDEGEGDEGEDEGGSSNAKKKQSTRMLKAECTTVVDGEPCGYTVRLSKKWALKLGACCPVHGALEVEGADSGEPEDEED
jgi:hypothetical protein